MSPVSEEVQITTFCSGLCRWDKLLLWCESPPIHLASLCAQSPFWHPWVDLIQSAGILKIWFGSGSFDRSRPSLKLPSRWFEEASDYLFLGRRHPHVCKGSPIVAYIWSPNLCVKDVVNANQVVFSFLARAFAPNLCDLIWSFSSWPLQSCQWHPESVT